VSRSALYRLDPDRAPTTIVALHQSSKPWTLRRFLRALAFGETVPSSLFCLGTLLTLLDHSASPSTSAHSRQAFRRYRTLYARQTPNVTYFSGCLGTGFLVEPHISRRLPCADVQDLPVHRELPRVRVRGSERVHPGPQTANNDHEDTTCTCGVLP
jgi:hypothetical protein